MDKKVFILGAGGHAKVCFDVLVEMNCIIAGFIDRTGSGLLFDYPVLSEEQFFGDYVPNEVLLVNGIGTTGEDSVRKNVYLSFKEAGYFFKSIIHPMAYLSSRSEYDEGVQIFAGAIIQPGVKLGENVIVNTKTSVDHDCFIGPHTHLAPGVTLCGNAIIHKDCFIGAGATIKNNITVGENTLIGAGSLVLNNISSGKKVFGSPAKEVR